jgi:hypothetical protein
MGTNETLQKVVNNESKTDPLQNAENSFRNKLGSHFKKIVLISSLAGAALLFKGCAAGYVASEPSYMEYDRPVRPSTLSIWIDGDWSWNNRSQQYYQKTGYWENPRQGQTYVSGHWDTSQKGKSWSKGYWQSESNHKNRIRIDRTLFSCQENCSLMKTACRG